MRRSSTVEKASTTAPLKPRNDGGCVMSTSKPNAGTRNTESVRSSYLPKCISGVTPIKTPLPGTSKSQRHSRNSFFGRTSVCRGDVKKDTRPLNDRSYQVNMLNALINFLTARKYNFPINVFMNRTSLIPSKDFFRVIEFIYHHINVKHTLNETRVNNVDEVLAVLKETGYPYTIQKSSIISSISKQLGAISWLREYVEYIDYVTLNINSLMFPSEDFENATENEMLFNVNNTYYTKYLHGHDLQDEEEIGLRTIAEKMINIPCDSDDDVEGDVMRLEKELQLLENQPDKISDLKDSILSCESDIQKYDNYLKQLHSHVMKKEAQNNELVREIAVLNSTVKTQDENISYKERIVKAQEISLADLERIRMERDELQRQISNLLQDSSEYDKDINEKNIKAANLKHEIELTLNKFNEIYKRTAHVNSSKEGCPETIMNLPDKDLSLPDDFELRVNFSQREYMMWITEIKPKLQKSNDLLANKIEKMRDRLVDNEECIQKLTDIENEQAEEIVLIEKQIDELNNDLQQKNQEYVAEQQRLSTEEERLRDEMKAVSSGEFCKNSDLADLEEKIKEMQIRLQDEINYRSQYEKETDEFLYQVCSKVKEHFDGLAEIQICFDEKAISVVKTLQEYSHPTENNDQ